MHLAEVDSSTGLSAIKRWHSRKMAYLRKTHRISISALHEVYYGEAEDPEPDDSRTLNRLAHRSGDADALTKALPAAKHWKCAAGLCLVALPGSELDGSHTLASPSGAGITL